ncbi:MAG: hypothetical protein ACI4WT_06325 [Oligosphaeraceae bacterium]
MARLMPRVRLPHPFKNEEIAAVMMKLVQSVRRILPLAPLSAAVLLLLSACASAPSYRGETHELRSYPYATARQRPELWVTYYPAFLSQPTPEESEPAGERGRAKPRLLSETRALRDHNGSWTDDAMRHDLDAMQSAGFVGAFLTVRPQDLTDAARLERIRHFMRLAAGCRPVFRVGLCLYADAPLEMGSGNIAQFLLQNGLARPAPSPRLAVIFDAASITLNRQDFHEERLLDILVLQPDGSFLPPRPIAFIRAGDSGAIHGIDWRSQAKWRIPRGDGSFLADKLRQAFISRRPTVILHSWNRFADGSFLVPNTFDGTLLLDTLAAELDRLEVLRLKATPLAK